MASLATMSNKSRTSPRSGSIINSVIGRISLVVIFTCTFAAGMLLLFLVNQTWLPQTLKFTIILMSALVAGTLSRRLLTHYSRPMRYSTAWFAFIVALAVLYRLTRGFIGIELSFNASSNPNWNGLSQVGIGLLIIWLTQKAWLDKIAVIPNAPTIEHSNRDGRRFGHVKRPWFGMKRPAVFKVAFWKSLLASIVSAPGKVWQRVRPPVKLRVNRNQVRPRTSRKKFFPRLKRKQVQLNDDVEYLCPYCLEEVKPKDPRGITTCKVCGTPHHADCWAVTGVCQVPHQNT
jgi:hypothetical protein